MKSTVQIFSELSARLAGFGTDESSRSIVARVVAENEWFSVGDIRYAIEALRSEMLDTQKVAEWLTHYPSLTTHRHLRVAIIMAGNIPLVGFFDLMCVIASGNIPFVKPSSKDSVLESYIEQLLLEIEPKLQIGRYNEEEEYDAIIATGGDSANTYFRTKFEGTSCLLRGSRHSVAVLSGKETKEEINALANDIFTYSGLGCRSISLIFIPKGDRLTIPTRKMCRAYHNNYLQCKALLTMRGVKFKDLGEAVLVRQEKGEFPRFLSQINIVEYTKLDEVKSWLAENDNSIQCVASKIEGLHSRCIALGQAQRPTLFDYADERDTMQFLSNID